MNLKTADVLASNDIWITTDTFRCYRWTGSAWQIIFSKQFEDILEVATSGAGKIPRLDTNTGKGDFDIMGSPERIFDKEIDFQNLRNESVRNFV